MQLLKLLKMESCRFQTANFPCLPDGRRRASRRPSAPVFVPDDEVHAGDGRSPRVTSPCRLRVAVASCTLLPSRRRLGERARMAHGLRGRRDVFTLAPCPRKATSAAWSSILAGCPAVCGIPYR